MFLYFVSVEFEWSMFDDSKIVLSVKKKSGGFGESNVVLYSVYIDCFCINNSYLFLNQKKSSS